MTNPPQLFKKKKRHIWYNAALKPLFVYRNNRLKRSLFLPQIKEKSNNFQTNFKHKRATASGLNPTPKQFSKTDLHAKTNTHAHIRHLLYNLCVLTRRLWQQGFDSHHPNRLILRPYVARIINITVQPQHLHQYFFFSSCGTMAPPTVRTKVSNLRDPDNLTLHHSPESEKQQKYPCFCFGTPHWKHGEQTGKQISAYGSVSFSLRNERIFHLRKCRSKSWEN